MVSKRCKRAVWILAFLCLINFAWIGIFSDGLTSRFRLKYGFNSKNEEYTSSLNAAGGGKVQGDESVDKEVEEDYTIRSLGDQEQQSQKTAKELEDILSKPGIAQLKRVQGPNAQLSPKLPENPKTKTILIWSDKLSRIWSWNTDIIKCPKRPYECHFTTDRKDVTKADSLVFHYTDVNKLNNGLEWPPIRYPHQTWIFANRESQLMSPSNPNKYTSLVNVFNYTLHYCSKADIVVPYGECRHLSAIARDPQTDVSRKQLAEAAEYIENPPNVAAKKSKAVCWIASNCRPRSRRDLYVKELRKYIPVDIYGKCGEKGHIRRDPETTELTMQNYKFYLAFENSFCEDYITEKLFKLLLPGDERIVPVVLGSGHYKELLPPHSYIDVKDFTSAKDLASYLQRLDANDEEYNAYFTWRKYYGCDQVWPPCVLCDSLHAFHEKTHIVPSLATLQSKDLCTPAEVFYQNITDINDVSGPYTRFREGNEEQDEDHSEEWK